MAVRDQPASETPVTQDASQFLSRHRLEGLTDGIYAITMTLLVLELKVPGHDIHDAAALQARLIEDVPRLLGFALSFFVLAMFWLGGQRLLQHLSHVDGGLLRRYLLGLLLSCLVPYSSALVSDFVWAAQANWVYAANLGLMGVMGLLQSAYVRRRPALRADDRDRPAVWRAARVRLWSLIGCALASSVAAAFVPRWATLAYGLMVPAVWLAGRIERRAAPAMVQAG